MRAMYRLTRQVIPRLFHPIQRRISRISIIVSQLLTTSQLACERGEFLLFSGLDLTIKSGDLLQITGPNGCGKTSLLRLLAGLSLPSEGSIKRETNKILYLGHQPAIKLSLSAIENLRWYCPDKSLPELQQALANWGLAGFEDVHCEHLSAGQKQRVALCRLLLADAPLWLLDEPFTAIDRAGIQQLEQCFLQHSQRGGAIIFTSHHPFSPTEKLREITLRRAG